MYSAIVFCVCIFVSGCLAVSERCIPSTNKDYSSCSCKMNTTNKFINLFPLQNSTVVPRFTATANASEKEEEDWKFSFNPCKPYDMFVGTSNISACKQVAVSRWTSPRSIHSVCKDLGDQDSVHYDTTHHDLTEHGLGWSNVTLQFKSREEKLYNRAFIHLVCKAHNLTKEDSTFYFLREDHTRLNDYYFALESPCGCPGLCGEPPSSEPTAKPSKGDDDDKWLIIGVSIGAVLLLLLIVLAVICCRKGKPGYTEV